MCWEWNGLLLLLYTCKYGSCKVVSDVVHPQPSSTSKFASATCKGGARAAKFGSAEPGQPPLATNLLQCMIGGPLRLLRVVWSLSRFRLTCAPSNPCTCVWLVHVCCLVGLFFSQKSPAYIYLQKLVETVSNKPSALSLILFFETFMQEFTVKVRAYRPSTISPVVHEFYN